ncbi:MAG TPA: hypothetical protein VNG12_11000, partial [Acidimicrobiales bacterium]|nr:hypothetical protein [Acidimicrobiales bacterium]
MTRPVRRHPADIEEVAVALGRLNGERWVPDLPGCDLRNLLAVRARFWLEDEGWRSALALGSLLRMRLTKFLQASDRLLEVFAGLNQVLCHQDATRLNVRLRRGPGARRVA